MSQVIPPTLFCLCRAFDIAAVETIVKADNYDVVLCRDSNLPDDERICYVLRFCSVVPFLINLNILSFGRFLAILEISIVVL